MSSSENVTIEPPGIVDVVRLAWMAPEVIWAIDRCELREAERSHESSPYPEALP